MAAIAETLALALHNHQAGHLQQAEQGYRQVLLAAPQNAEALHLLGIVSCQQGRYPLGIDCLRQAVAADPVNGDYACDLAVAYQNLGRLDEAVACFELALRLKPDGALVWYNLGNLHQGRGQLDQAVDCYRQALLILPDYVVAHFNLGNALIAQGKLAEAVGCYRQAVGLRPDYTEGYFNLGVALYRQGLLDEALASYRQALRLQPAAAEVHNHLGNVLKDQGRLDEARAAYQQALRLRPDDAEVLNNLGTLCQDQDRLDEAVACLRQALCFRPNFALAHNNLGNALLALGKLEEAVASYRRAIQLQPDNARAHNNLGNGLKEQGQLEEALRSYDEALRLQPDLVAALWNRAVVWLLQGRFEPGWRDYEWRWRRPHSGFRAFPQPLWDGSALEGKRILLHAEQGQGDTLQFIRYAPLVRQRGGTVLLECPPALVRLLSHCDGVDQILAAGSDLPDFDCQAPLLSLPRIFGTRLGTMPVPIPYLTAEADRVAHWRQALASHPGLKVGICWQGSPTHLHDRRRSVPLEQFAPLARVGGVCLVSLQRGPGSEQLASRARRFAVLELPGRSEEPAQAWVDTAALIGALDLVVTVDTAVAHLAGALGVPVWVALPFMPDWRWLLERQDSPWYPTMRLFRQHAPGTWKAVFDRIAEELRASNKTNHGLHR